MHLRRHGPGMACTGPRTVFFCTKTNSLAAILGAGTTRSAGAAVTTFYIGTNANCETTSDGSVAQNAVANTTNNIAQNIEENTGANTGRNIGQKTEENTGKNTDKKTTKTGVMGRHKGRSDGHHVPTWATDRCCANGPRSMARR